MTVEARDVLDKIHADVKGETRSESIEWFWIRYINLSHQNASSSDYENTLLRRITHSEDRATKAKKEAQQWKLIAWSMTAACVALIATMMLTAS